MQALSLSNYSNRAILHAIFRRELRPRSMNRAVFRRIARGAKVCLAFVSGVHRAAIHRRLSLPSSRSTNHHSYAATLVICQRNYGDVHRGKSRSHTTGCSFWTSWRLCVVHVSVYSYPVSDPWNSFTHLTSSSATASGCADAGLPESRVTISRSRPCW